MPRPITLGEAKARYVHRYTMEHVPQWARVAAHNGKFYAPQYQDDTEWYRLTEFNGEGVIATAKHCYSHSQTWPLGQWLDRPYQATGNQNHGI